MTATTQKQKATRARRLLATTAIAACLLQAAPAHAQTITHETVTESPGGTTMTRKTVTETAPAATTVHTTVTELPGGDTVVNKTVTTAAPETTRTETTWKTEEHSLPAIGSRTIVFSDFDLNKDGIMSINEIGKMLFKLYDTDGNEVIDNIEYERKAVMTVVPVEEKTKITYDFDGDGLADKETRTTRDFMEATRLAAFDGNGDGLSPHEFMQRRFNQADVNHDHAIDEAEWRGSYLPRVDARNKAKARFNK